MVLLKDWLPVNQQEASKVIITRCQYVVNL
jgi:hypothetical protein